MRNTNKNILSRFKKASISYAFLKISLFSALVVEALLFLYLFIFSYSSLALGVVTAALLVTGFAYLIMYFYFQVKRPEMFLSLKDSFIGSCKQLLSMPANTAEYHLSVVNASLKLFSHLNDYERRFYFPPKNWKMLKPLFERASIILHKDDVFRMKELLLVAAIKEHIEQIKITPTDLEMHASLANCYSALAKTYSYYQEEPFTKKIKTAFKQKFDEASMQAIEELKIINDYAPNDPWIHAQLAKNYHNLKMKEEEKTELEILHSLSPHDSEVLFKLGVLYFELAKAAKGLKVYEQLKRSDPKKADELLSFYGAKKTLSSLEDSLIS
jgi:hypothetical protein